jgi:hypothetical protein
LDPDERRIAILAKHGFKPHENIRSDNNSDDPLKDVDTIPEHVLNDDILYKKYLKENTFLPSSSDSSGSSTPTKDRDPKSGSFSSLMNILNAVKKSTMQKSAIDSRQKLEDIKGNQSQRRLTASDLDLSAVPGSCRNMKDKFDSGRMFEDETQKYSTNENVVAKSTSCSNMQSLWENHLISSSTSQQSHYRSTEELPPSKSGHVIQAKHDILNSSSNRPEKRSTDDLPSQGGNMVAQMKDLLANGTLTNEDVKKYLDDRSVVGEMDSIKRRKVLLNETPLNSNIDEISSSSVKQELEALRKSGQMKSTFKIEHGRDATSSRGSYNKSQLRRSLSSTGVAGESRTIDLDEEVMGDLSVSNSMVRAMFEANAPKYKFGGSSEKLNDSNEKSKQGDSNKRGKY